MSSNQSVENSAQNTRFLLVFSLDVGFSLCSSRHQPTLRGVCIVMLEDVPQPAVIRIFWKNLNWKISGNNINNSNNISIRSQVYYIYVWTIYKPWGLSISISRQFNVIYLRCNTNIFICVGWKNFHRKIEHAEIFPPCITAGLAMQQYAEALAQKP